MAKIIKMKDLLDENHIELGKIYTDKDRPPFQVNEYGAKSSDLVGTSKKQFGTIYKMKEDMKEGKFDPKNPQVLIHGFGVYTLKTLEKAIQRDLKECISKDAEFTAMKLYMKHSTTEAKIKAANDVYKQMDTSQFKRAVTMYKRKK
tara:strand:- start:463 stop:900 length:438 start_codon:yes stop_codon:yes gene_type:complete